MEIGGKKIPKGVIWGGIAAVGVGAFLLFRHSASSSSGSGSSSSSIDPVTGLPYSEDNTVDPATGMTYLAEAQQYGSVAAAEAQTAGSYSAASGYGGISGYVGTAGYPSYTGGTTSPTAETFASNAQWAQQVEQDLTNIGYAPTDVAGAVGRYLARLPLSSTQAGIIQVALAEDGPPPQGSYSVISQPSSGGSTPPSGHTGGGTGPGGGGTGGGTPPNHGGGIPNPGGPNHGLKGIPISQPHAIDQGQAEYLWSQGKSDVYWKANDGSFVATHTGQGVGQLYTGANGWAFLQSKHKA